MTALVIYIVIISAFLVGYLVGAAFVFNKARLEREERQRELIDSYEMLREMREKLEQLKAILEERMV